MHEIERNRSQKLGCQANGGGARAGRAPLDPPMLRDEIRKMKESSKPSTQRQRKINRLKDKGRQDGRIADDIDIMRKFNAMMKRPFRTPIRPRPKIMIAEKKRRRSFKLPALATVIQNDKGYGNFFSSGPIRLVLEKS